MALDTIVRVDRYFYRRSLRVLILLVVILLAWITFIVVTVERKPVRGAPSLAALEQRAAAALRGHNADDLDALFDEDSIGDSYAADYLATLATFGPSGLDVRVASTAAGRTLVVVARSTSSAGASCTAWPITQDDDRWYLSGDATLLPAAGCP